MSRTGDRRSIQKLVRGQTGVWDFARIAAALVRAIARVQSELVDVLGREEKTEEEERAYLSRYLRKPRPSSFD